MVGVVVGGVVPPRRGHLGHRVDPVDDVGPERLDVRGAGHDAGHAHDGDVADAAGVAGASSALVIGIGGGPQSFRMPRRRQTAPRRRQYARRSRRECQETRRGPREVNRARRERSCCQQAGTASSVRLPCRSPHAAPERRRSGRQNSSPAGGESMSTASTTRTDPMYESVRTTRRDGHPRRGRGVVLRGMPGRPRLDVRRGHPAREHGGDGDRRAPHRALRGQGRLRGLVRRARARRHSSTSRSAASSTSSSPRSRPATTRASRRGRAPAATDRARGHRGR